MPDITLLPNHRLHLQKLAEMTGDHRYLQPGSIHFRGNYANKPIGRWNSPGPLLPIKSPWWGDEARLLTHGGVEMARYKTAGKVDMPGHSLKSPTTKMKPIPPNWTISSEFGLNGIMPPQPGGKGYRVLIQTPNRILVEPSWEKIDRYGADFLKDRGQLDFTSHHDFEKMLTTQMPNTQHVDPKRDMKLIAEFDRMPFAHEYLAFRVKYPKASPEDVADYFANKAKQNLSGKIENLAGTERSVAAKHGWQSKGRFYPSIAGVIGALGLSAAAKAGVPGAEWTQSVIDKYDPHAIFGRAVEKQATKSPWWNQNVIDPIADTMLKVNQEKAKADAEVLKLRSLLHRE